MENLDELTFKALERYFTVLQKVGYMKDKDVNKLLLLTFIHEILLEFPYYITEDDYNMLNNIIVCLWGSTCLVPFIQYRRVSLPLTNYIYSIPIRISEDADIRFSLEYNERLVNN